MVAGAAKVAIVRRSLLFTMSRADAAVQVENDHLRRATVVNTVDPNPVHVGQSFNICIGRQKFRLEPPHLAGGCSLSFHGFAANNPTHGGITSQTLGIIHVFITANASKQRLAELTRHAVPSILAGTAVLKDSPGNLCQAKGVIKLSIGEEPTVGGNLGTVELQLQSAVKIDPQRGLYCFHPPGDVRRVCSDVRMTLILIAESYGRRMKYRIYLGNGR